MKRNKKSNFYGLILTIFVSLFFVGCLPDVDSVELDIESPEVSSITWNSGNKLFDLTREGNQSFETVLDKGRNTNVSINSKITITFSEDMLEESLIEYGVSESVILIEGEPSKTLLSDLKTTGLSDTNAKKIIKVKMQMVPNHKDAIILDFENAFDNCNTEIQRKLNFCQLKKDTSYSLIIGSSVMDLNGRTLAVDNNGSKKEDNFVLLFKTIGDPPKVTSTSPSSGELDVCPNLKDAIITFDTEMDVATLTKENIYIAKSDGTKFTSFNSGEIAFGKLIHLNLTANLEKSTAYKLIVTTGVRSTSRVPLIQQFEAEFRTSDTISTTGPIFMSGPTAVATGSSIQLNFSTDVDSKATIKYQKSGGAEIILDEGFSKIHYVDIPVSEAGNYTIKVLLEDKCGNSSVEKTINVTIESHPMITEVSANAPIVEFIELYNPGEDAIDLSNYKIKIGSETAVNLPTYSLGAKDYVVVIESSHDESAFGTKFVKANIKSNLSKGDNVELILGDNAVDSYTYDLKASFNDNKSAQKKLLTLDSEYCENTPTPGAANNCQ